MSVTEGIGKPIGYALVIGGAIFAAWYLLKDFDWSSLNPFKDFKWPDPSQIFINVIPGGEQIAEVAEETNKPLLGEDTPGDISVKTLTDSLLPGGGIVVGLNTLGDIWDLLTSKEENNVVQPSSSPISPEVQHLPGGAASAYTYLQQEIKKDTSGYLGGYLEPIGWVDDRDTATKYDYPLWRDMYTGELMLGSDVNYVRSLDNLLLTDIRLGEEGRHTWWLT